MIDLSKLSPAPWADYVRDAKLATCNAKGEFTYVTLAGNQLVGNPTDREFIVLARNAFDVMMQRKWWVIAGRKETNGENCWFVYTMAGSEFLEINKHPAPWPTDPFSALVEADKWYRVNVEGVPPNEEQVGDLVQETLKDIGPAQFQEVAAQLQKNAISKRPTGPSSSDRP